MSDAPSRESVELDDIRAAHERIVEHVHRTPMFSSRTIDARIGSTVRFKAESMQRTGSFKPRGAVHRISRLTDDERARGIVTVSAGNHAQAAAYACARVSVPCAVVMPANAPAVKIDATRGYGAEVVLHDDMRTLFQRCEALRAERSATFLHPFDHPAIVAGTGTVGLEIHEDFPDVRTVICGVGGGGLISGVARAMKRLDPTIRVFGVEPEGAPTMTLALERGEPVRLESIDTIADGLSAPFAGELNLAIIQTDVDAVFRVDDAAIIEAMRLLFDRMKLVVEPAGAAALAALLTGVIPALPEDRIAVVLSGGNVDAARYGQWFGRA